VGAAAAASDGVGASGARTTEVALYLLLIICLERELKRAAPEEHSRSPAQGGPRVSVLKTQIVVVIALLPAVSFRGKLEQSCHLRQTRFAGPRRVHC